MTWNSHWSSASETRQRLTRESEIWWTMLSEPTYQSTGFTALGSGILQQWESQHQQQNDHPMTITWTITIEIIALWITNENNDKYIRKTILYDLLVPEVFFVFQLLYATCTCLALCKACQHIISWWTEYFAHFIHCTKYQKLMQCLSQKISLLKKQQNLHKLLLSPKTTVISTFS